ncbi:DNA polymerase-3 subunit delta [Wenyingzhuangia heitensis]|uniref:DNA polymerase III subunit delta n=1 Tax=Wenyingzhuangia heitensis TaxID=1487859 RepID=A0ABX0UFI0_9FLAO|nr:DNA polymerase III subunit delta [Wenyingzhuangia heitensis]NIJ46181.1 DNA polymerase-3 subunit delta [Wenyingzhuangia heitensis]
MAEVKQLVTDIKNGNIKPIYFLMGEEPYYIDKIADFIEDTILTEDEKGFNQTIVYGRDVSIDDIVGQAKQYPMMSEKTVVIVKEAQDLSRTIENLATYAEKPLESTVLVICYKYKTLDKRKKLIKTINKSGVVFESKKLYENQVGDWISGVLKGKKYQIEPKATQMLVEFLGTNLSKISNELDKLMLILPQQTSITPKHIEENIGISKDYNIFELRKAIGKKEILKCNQIITYFSENPKSNPLVMTISLINSYFTQLLMYHGLKDKSKGNVAKALRVNPYFVDDYVVAAKHYPMRKVSQVIALLREADVKSKGVGAANTSDSDLLKELLFKILH